MKQFLLFTQFFIISLNAFSQIEYTINDFSDTYYAVFIVGDDQKEEVFKEGTMLLFSRKTGKTLIETECESIAFEDVALSSSKKIIVPYEGQSMILYEDYNFDGKNDLAVQQYYSSKGPSYSIYLSKNNTFEYDSAYTKIIRNSQGNFDLDTLDKKIYTRGNGGCCWHSFSTYSIQNTRPVLISEVIEESDFAFTTTTTKELKDGKMIETVEKTFNSEEEGIIGVMSFNLMDKNKKVILFNINDRTLNYALLSEDDRVEFSYPVETVYANPDFTLSNDGNNLLFKNNDAAYKVYQIITNNMITGIGVLVIVNGKTYDLKGDIKSLSGNLKKITKLDNVVFK